MSSRPTLSRFTPSLMAHELLERLFVGRERTLDAVMARVERAAASDERNHTLLVGPRGAGKTHLVSLVYHRVNRLRADGVRLQVAWLPEDPWTITTYRHLLAAVAKHLEPPVEGDVPKTADDLEVLLRARAAERGPVVVVLENLDQILSAIGKTGQQQLRHVLQADRSLLLVATSTRLDRTLSDQASPFYSFFTTTRLEPFGVEEAAAMLTAVAREQGDDELIDYLGSDEGRARLRTIAHLAGGQPRMWAALASALTVGGLKDLVDLLLTRFDDLTPYYQEQLGRLSGQQRLVVAELAELDRPINVKELAERLEIDQRSLGKTMVELVDRGWAAPTTSPVTAHLTDRRKTYYELAEPLARLSFQIKESRGEPLKLVVEFLKHWFEPAQLVEAEQDGIADYLVLAAAGQANDPVVTVTRQLHRLPETQAPATTLLGEIADALSALTRGDPEPFLALAVPIRMALESRLADSSTARVEEELYLAARRDLGHDPGPAIDAWIARAERLVPARDGADRALSQLLLADFLARAWRFDEAEEVLAEALSRAQTDDNLVLAVRSSVASAAWQAGDVERSTALTEAVLTDCARVRGTDHPATLIAKNNVVTAYSLAGRLGEAISIAESALVDFERVMGADHRSTLTLRQNLAVLYRERGSVTDALRLTEAVVDDRARSLGPEHLATLMARSNLMVLLSEAGQLEEALAMAQTVVADHVRVLGLDDPSTMTARLNAAAVYWRAGRQDEALALAESALSGFERILGSEHPKTVAARQTLRTIADSPGRAEHAAAAAERIPTPKDDSQQQQR